MPQPTISSTLDIKKKVSEKKDNIDKVSSANMEELFKLKEKLLKLLQ